jgi:hypothetical protein
MNSFRFFTGRSGCTTYRLGTLESSEMGREVLDRVVGQLVEDVRVHSQRADVAQDERVVVGGVGHFLHGNVAGCARLVLDEHALTDGFAHFARDGTRHDFRAATWRKRHHHPNGFGGPGAPLGVGLQATQACGHGRQVFQQGATVNGVDCVRHGCVLLVWRKGQSVVMLRSLTIRAQLAICP